MLYELTHARVNDSLEISNYDDVRASIVLLANEMKRTIVAEEDIPRYKKLLAETRKEFNRLDAERKRVKQEVMEPYKELETQFKELKSILYEGQQHLDQQIKRYEEEHRNERWSEIEQEFQRFQRGYNAPNWLTFEMFKAKYPKLANKSTAKSKATDAMTEFFETFYNDYNWLKQVYPVRNDRTSVLAVYVNNGLNIMKAVSDFESVRLEGQRLEQEEVAENVVIDDGTATNVEEYVSVKVKVSDVHSIAENYDVVL